MTQIKVKVALFPNLPRFAVVLRSWQGNWGAIMDQLPSAPEAVTL